MIMILPVTYKIIHLRLSTGVVSLPDCFFSSKIRWCSNIYSFFAHEVDALVLRGGHVWTPERPRTGQQQRSYSMRGEMLQGIGVSGCQLGEL